MDPPQAGAQGAEGETVAAVPSARPTPPAPPTPPPPRSPPSESNPLSAPSLSFLPPFANDENRALDAEIKVRCCPGDSCALRAILCAPPPPPPLSRRQQPFLTIQTTPPPPLAKKHRKKKLNNRRCGCGCRKPTRRPTSKSSASASWTATRAPWRPRSAGARRGCVCCFEFSHGGPSCGGVFSLSPAVSLCPNSLHTRTTQKAGRRRAARGRDAASHGGHGQHRVGEKTKNGRDVCRGRGELRIECGEGRREGTPVPCRRTLPPPPPSSSSRTKICILPTTTHKKQRTKQHKSPAPPPTPSPWPPRPRRCASARAARPPRRAPRSRAPTPRASA